ncbi:Reticulon-like protein B1 [Hibiscus syriacus]|uniref:Reticulon-like protein n=1 Tax=Hibiscus syriacus TaxID=106335 RepID=A0A6A3DAX6_HIBSY|nr:Reticulon-like protein B1 [Hibiscus syriacus]
MEELEIELVCSTEVEKRVKELMESKKDRLRPFTFLRFPKDIKCTLPSIFDRAVQRGTTVDSRSQPSAFETLDVWRSNLSILEVAPRGLMTVWMFQTGIIVLTVMHTNNPKFHVRSGSFVDDAFILRITIPPPEPTNLNSSVYAFLSFETNRTLHPMAELIESKMEEIADKISEKIHRKSSSTSSSSDSDDDKRSHGHKLPFKSKVYRLFGREKPLHQVLGAGKPADILLWRNKRVSGAVLGGVTAFWFLFEVIDYHLITLVCHILILSLSVLFLWSNASHFINNSPPTIPEAVISEKCLLKAASCLLSEINRAAVAGLWFVSVLGSCFNFLTLVYVVFLLLYTVPVLYEKYEDKVDAHAEKAMIEIKKQYVILEKKVMANINKGKKRD